MKLRYYIIGGVVIVLFIIVARSAGWIGGKPSIPIDTLRVKRQHVTESITASGRVYPVLGLEISPDVSGEITAMYIKEGDYVEAGQLLLNIRPDNFVTALARTRANYDQNNAELSRAEANLAASEADFLQAEKNYERQKKLFAERAISKAEFERAETAYKVNEQRLESSRHDVSSRRYRLNSSRASVQEAQEDLRLTNIVAPISGYITKLRIEKGERVVGTRQRQGTSMLEIANLDSMEVRAEVVENDVVRLELGDSTLIDIESFSYLDKPLKGILTAIGGSAKEKTSVEDVTEFEIRIKIDTSAFAFLSEVTGQAKPLRPGMTASVEVFTERKESVLTVPLGAVAVRSKDLPLGEDEDEEDEEEEERRSQQESQQAQKQKQKNYEEVIFVYKEGVVAQRTVKTGINSFELIEVIEGVEEDEMIVSGPFLAVSKKLKDGDKVKIRKPRKKEEGQGRG